jgi:hypothetical protein
MWVDIDKRFVCYYKTEKRAFSKKIRARSMNQSSDATEL